MRVAVEQLEAALGEILADYGDYVVELTGQALDAGAKVLVRELKAASPRRTGQFARSWRVKKKYKLRRYVGNTKTVPGPRGQVPLSNLLEYGQRHGHPFIRRTYQSSSAAVARAMVEEIKKG